MDQVLAVGLFAAAARAVTFGFTKRTGVNWLMRLSDEARRDERFLVGVSRLSWVYPFQQFDQLADAAAELVLLTGGFDAGVGHIDTSSQPHALLGVALSTRRAARDRRQPRGFAEADGS